MLLDILRTSDADGLNPNLTQIAALEIWLSHLKQTEIPQRDRALSEAFVNEVREVRRLNDSGMIWVDPELRPSVVFPRRLLDEAAAAPSLEAYLAGMRWMNPIYVGLRRAIIAGGDGHRDQLIRNLDRARALPSGSERYVIVNAASAQLTMVEGGRGSRFDAGRGRQADLSDADDGRADPLHVAQAGVERPARPRRRADRARGRQAGDRISQAEGLP